MYNSLRYAKILEESGFTKQQAEVQIQMITELVEENFVREIKDLENRFELRFRDIENKMVLMEHRLTIKLGAIVSVSLTVAVGVATVVARLI